MSWEQNVRRVVPYVAGEQPNKPGMIKLNTNECPYPPAPGVERLLKRMDYGALRLYPDPDTGVLVDALAEYYHVSPGQVFQRQTAHPVPGRDLFLLRRMGETARDSV